MSTPITLKEIYESATGLLKRFDLMPDIDTAWMKCLEEFTEMTEALYELQCRPRNEIFKSAAAMETCDLIVTLMNVMYSSEVKLEYLSLDRTFKELSDDGMIESMTLKDTWIFMHKCMNSYYSRLQSFNPLSDLMSRHAEQCGSAVLIIRCAMRLGDLYGLSIEDFERSMESVMFKNNQKTHETHEIVDGMIKKRKPQGESAS